MHTDEAVHADKFRTLLENGRYEYNRNEYHGPTLNYATLVPARLSSADEYTEITEVTLRIVPVLFGVGLVVLTVLLADGLGLAAVLAAVLVALSPAMVFYSRYYIQEMLLVCLTFGAIASGYRYARTRASPWALMTGVFAGLMHATKETAIIAFGSMGLALIVMVFVPGKGRSVRQVLTGIRPVHVVLGIVAAMAVSALFYSSFLTHPRGILDSYLTYATYLGRAGGEDTRHVYPWYHYLHILLFARYGQGPIWTEGWIVLLALAGMAAAVKGERLIPITHEFFVAPHPALGGSGKRRLADGFAHAPSAKPPALPLPPGDTKSSIVIGIGPIDPKLVRFLALHTVILTVVYSAIPYKTPWCLLSFLHGMILLAGVGAVTLLAWARRSAGRVVVLVILIAAAGHLALQAYRANFVYYADSRNPYVYAHPTEEIFIAVEKVREYAGLGGLGYSEKIPLQVAVPGDDYWPLPWYLRSLKVEWRSDVPEHVGPLILISDKLEGALTQRLYVDTPRDKWQMYMYLFDEPYYVWARPQVKLLGFVRKSLWDEHTSRQSDPNELIEREHGWRSMPAPEQVREFIESIRDK